MDYHLHGNTSVDTKLTLKEIYDIAVQKGIKNICYTNHQEPMEFVNGKTDQSLTPDGLARYKQEFSEVKKDSKINVYFGTEVSYNEGFEKETNKFINENDFDFVLGSVHYALGMHLADKRDALKIQMQDPAKICKDYFRLLAKAIKSGMFDVIAHADLYKRKMINEPDFALYKKQWERIAELLKKHKVGFEINTSYKKDKYDGTYPDERIIRLFVEKGVNIITLGSDSHKPEQVGYRIDEMEKLLKSMGVKQVCIFEKRKPRFISL